MVRVSGVTLAPTLQTRVLVTAQDSAQKGRG